MREKERHARIPPENSLSSRPLFIPHRQTLSRVWPALKQLTKCTTICGLGNGRISSTWEPADLLKVSKQSQVEQHSCRG